MHLWRHVVIAEPEKALHLEPSLLSELRKRISPIDLANVEHVKVIRSNR